MKTKVENAEIFKAGLQNWKEKVTLLEKARSPCPVCFNFKVGCAGCILKPRTEHALCERMRVFFDSLNSLFVEAQQIVSNLEEIHLKRGVTDG